MTEALRPCPFCGEAAKEYLWKYHYGCSNESCGGYAANLTLDQWNRRAEPSPNPVQDKIGAEMEAWERGYAAAMQNVLIDGARRMMSGEAEPVQATCTWTRDEGFVVWATACANTFCIGDTPAEDDMRFCCYCGGLVEAINRTGGQR